MDIIFDHCEFENVHFNQCSLSRVHFISCRISGMEFSQSLMQDILFQLFTYICEHIYKYI